MTTTLILVFSIVSKNSASLVDDGVKRIEWECASSAWPARRPWRDSSQKGQGAYHSPVTTQTDTDDDR